MPALGDGPFIREALEQKDYERLCRLLKIFSTARLDFPAWRDSFNALVALVEAPPAELAPSAAVDIRELAVARLRDLAGNLPVDGIEESAFTSHLIRLRAEIQADPYGRACHRGLVDLRLTGELPGELWELALQTLLGFFTSESRPASDPPHLNLVIASSSIGQLFRVDHRRKDRPRGCGNGWIRTLTGWLPSPSSSC
jgi:hypothetical protein